ncbi:MAG: AraC family transcriptional regulator [Clostridia bacterium]
MHDDFRLFHIKDKLELGLEYHYHEFDKIVIFISGSVTYMMEGTAYFLKPWDILLVGHDQVHRPIIDASAPYERIVLWINPNFLQQHSADGYSLSHCMELARARGFALIRMLAQERAEIIKLLYATESALASDEFAHDLLARTSLLQFLILLNRLADKDNTVQNPSAYMCDPKLSEILAYINNNLCADLSIDALSHKFFMSNSYLMHKFKAMTGYTAHSYITQKRLICSAELIKGGSPVVEASSASGFSDYSSFLRAFKKMFGCRPGEL